MYLRRIMMILLLFALVAAGTTMAAGQRVEFLGMSTEAPQEWVAEDPSSNMRLAQFRIPAPDGTRNGDAELVVYYFGPGQGGSIDANLQRWASQFSAPDGTPVEPVITSLSGSLAATLVELRGHYARGVGMGPTGDALPDRMLLAGIVETPEGNLYPQLHGPADLVAAQRDAFVDFVEGIAPASGQ